MFVHLGYQKIDIFNHEKNNPRLAGSSSYRPCFLW